MKKKFTILITAAFMLLTMIFQPGRAVGQTKITDCANIVSGTTYYIGATVSNTDYYLSVSHASTANVKGTGVTSTDNATTFLFEGSTNSWTLKFDNGLYVGALTNTNAEIVVAETGATFTTQNTTSGNLIQLKNGTRYIQKNSSSSLNFGSYNGNQMHIWLMEVPTGPVQLAAPTLTATPSNEKVTLTWNAVAGASSYSIQYADNPSFTGATTITEATSPKEITGLTNGTTYYFKAMSVGDDTNYISSDYGTEVSATPSNIVTITITQDDLADFTNTYAWYDWADGGVSGQAYAYKSGGMQFNSSKTAYWIYNSTAIPGNITSVKMTKASGTDRTWTLKAGTSALTTTNSGTQIGTAQTVGTSGTTWNVSGSYNYFLLYVSGGSTVIGSIEITYTPTATSDPSITADDAEIAFNATSGSITYEIENYVAGTMTASTTVDWISEFTYDQEDENGTVGFTTTTNPLATSRTATITLTYTYGDNQTATKNVTVTQNGNPDGPGTQNNPYTVAQAIANTPSSGNVYIQGIVSSFYNTSIVGDGSNYRYYISDDGTTTTQLLVYKGKGLNQATFTSADDLLVGDEVVIYGSLITYQNAPEVAANNYIVSLVRPDHNVATPTFSPEAGTYANEQTVTISCETESTTIYYTLDGTDPTSESTEYSSEISVENTTTIKAIAIKGSDTSTVATANYYICSQDDPYTVTEALAFEEYQYPANGIYVHGIVSTAPTQSPTNNGELTYFISVNGEAENELEVYKGKGLAQAAFTAQDNIQVGDIVTIYGNVQVYNNTIEFGSGNYLVEFERPAVPSITVANATVNVDAEGVGNTSLALTYENLTITDPADFDIQYYDGDGNELDKDHQPDWMEASIQDASPEGYEVSYSVDPNDGDARTAYFKVYALDDVSNFVYSNLVTINQAEHIAPAATITVADATVNVGAEGVGNSSLALTYENLTITDPADFDIQYYDGDGNELDKDHQPDWMEASIQDASPEGYEVSYSVDPNDSDARTAYFKVYALDDDSNIVYSNLVTVTQAAGSTPSGPYVRINDLSSLTDGSKVIIAARYDEEHTHGYYAMPGETSGKPTGVAFTSETSGDNEILPATITTSEDTYYWTVNVTENGYTFTNADSHMIGYSSSTNFATDGNNTEWTITSGTSESTALVAEYTGFVIRNKNTNTRAFAFNGTLFGAYATSNMNGQNSKDYNFYLDFFVQGATPVATPSITVTPASVAATANQTEGTLALTYTNLNITGANDFDIQFYDGENNELNDEPDWIAVSVEDGESSDYEVSYLIDANIGDARNAYFKVFAAGDPDFVYSNLVTVTQEAAAQAYTVSFMVNGHSDGEITSSCIELLPTTSTWTPEGFEITGWALENSTEAVASPYVPSANVTLYALLQLENTPTTSEDYVKVTEELTDWSGEYLIVYEDGGVAFDGSLDPLDVASNTIAVTITNNTIGADATTDASKFTITALSEGGYSIQSASGFYIGQTSDANGLACSTETAYANTISFDSENTCVDIVSSETHLRYNSADNQKRFRYYKSTSYTGQKAIQLYKKATPAVFNTVTVIDSTPAEPMTENILATTCIIVQDDVVLTFSGVNQGTASNLIIEDGGQLIHDDPVAATIQRYVNGYPSSKATGKSGYELIASPVISALNVATETNLTDDGEYDLYIFDQSKAQEEWRNYKKTPNPDFTSIENGKGYLYANSADVTISFSGTLKPSDENVEIVLDYEDGHPFTGWNLVGNPFACNAYASDTIGKSLAFYKMNDAGDDFEATTGPIAPMEGIFVYASATGKTFEFTRTAPASVPGKGNLNLEIAQVVTSRDAHQATDNAIIRFDGGNGLEKFSFSENNAKLYFPQNGKDYAVVSAEAQGELPVYFKAAENGTYTISFSMDNVEFGYLHLIDNKTGNDVDLRQTPSYTFEASTIDYASRFRLVFRAIGNENDSENNDFGFFDANGNFLILGIEGTATLQVMDVTGRVISNETFSGDYSMAINASAGVYMLRLIQGSNVRTQKVVVK